MSEFRETLEALVAAAEKVHKENQAQYHGALAARAEAEAAVREANAIASDSANELAAAKEALRKLNETAPIREVTGSGAVQASGAETQSEVN